MFNTISSNAIASKSKIIFRTFFCISGIYIKFEILSKKSSALQLISYRNYRLPNAELLKCPKPPVSEHLWLVNMLRGPKNCLNPDGSIFLKFFDHSETKSAPKTLFLAVSEILRLFVNILAPDDKYSLSVKASV